MFTLIDKKYNNVLYTDLSVEEMRPKQALDRDFLLTSDHSTTPLVGKTKLDRETNDFVYMTWAEVKLSRNRFLTASDWRDLPSYPGDDQEEWRTYRQELRDLPQDYTYVEDIIFPEEP